MFHCFFIIFLILSYGRNLNRGHFVLMHLSTSCKSDPPSLKLFKLLSAIHAQKVLKLQPSITSQNSFKLQNSKLLILHLNFANHHCLFCTSSRMGVDKFNIFEFKVQSRDTWENRLKGLAFEIGFEGFVQVEGKFVCMLSNAVVFIESCDLV